MGDNSNYKNALKATSLFGGVQVYNVLLKLVSSKFIAVLLGPEGMGIAGLLSSTTGIIGTITALGLGTSAVRDVSAAYSSGETPLFNRKVGVFRRLVWITGLLGMMSCLLLSPLLSKLSFGNYDFTLSYAVLSVTLLLQQISSGQTVVLRGARRFKDMAKASVVGSTIGLLISIPLYYLFGKRGIVPSMVISSAIGLSLSYYFSKKIKVNKVILNTREVLTEGKTMVQMGFFVALQSFINTFVLYLIRIYISNVGGMAEVGLYNSGFGMIEMSVGMVFAAMGAEYYPRLSSIANDENKFSETVNQQMSVSLLLISPIVALFLLMGPLAILLLLSSYFLPIRLMIQILALSMFFKAPGWCLGCMFLAKADTKAFWLNEMMTNIVMLFVLLILYKYFGLNGIALGYFLVYIYYLVVTGIICNRRYNYHLDPTIFRKYIQQFVICLAIFVCVTLIKGFLGYVLASVLSLACIYVSYKELNKIFSVKSFFDRIFRKIHNNQ